MSWRRMEEVGILLHSFLASILDGGEYWAVFRHRSSRRWLWNICRMVGGLQSRIGRLRVLLLFWKLGHDFLAIPPVDESLYRLSNLRCLSYSIVITQKASKTYSIRSVNRNTNKFLIGIPHGKRSIGTSRYKWDHYIKMNLMQVKC